MIDRDLALLYGVETKRLNEAVRRNKKRFEGDDFMFQLTKDEFKDVTRDCPILAEYKKRIAEKAKGKEYVFLFEISGGGFTSKTYFLTYTMERYGMKPYQRVQLLTPNEMISLWDWCCSQ